MRFDRAPRGSEMGSKGVIFAETCWKRYHFNLHVPKNWNLFFMVLKGKPARLKRLVLPTTSLRSLRMLQLMLGYCTCIILCVAEVRGFYCENSDFVALLDQDIG